jgi:V8-like Glu-specific endopeptidase
MSGINRARSRARVASGLALAVGCLGLAGISALAAAGPASAASPHVNRAPSAEGRLSGARGATAGVLVRASAQLTAYWDHEAAHARLLPAPPAKAVVGAVRTTVASPQGRATRIAGATGILAARSAVAPRLVHDFGSTGQPWYGSTTQAPATTTGKVFFTDHTGGNWVCSGSLVNSAGQDLVITAGHCVYGTAGGEIPAGETWHSNWVFAPDYSNGYAPYGYWSARQLWTLTNYINNDDEPDDLGAALLNTNSNGVKAVALLGGQGFAWNQSSSQFVYDFGYPAAAPFNGQTLQYCTNDAGFGWLSDMEFLPCNFTGGSSGGPWLMDFNGNWGYVDSVNDATGYFFYPGQMGGLYFGNNAMNLYQTVASL